MRGRGEPAGGGSWEGPASRQRWWTVTRPRGLFESSPSAGSRRCSGSQVLTKKTRATGVAVAVTTRLGAAAAGGACAAQRSSRWRGQRPWRPPPRPPCARAPCPSTGGARRHAGHTRHAPARARHARVTPPPPATAGHPPQRADTSALRGSEGGRPYLTCRRRRPWLSASVRSAHLSGVVAADHVHGGRTVASRRRPRSRLGPCQGQPNEAGPRVARYYFEDHVLYRGGAPKGLRAAHRPNFFFRVKDSGRAATAHAPHPPAPSSVATAPREKREQTRPLCLSSPPPAEAHNEPTRQTSSGGATLTPRPRAIGRRRQWPRLGSGAQTHTSRKDSYGGRATRARATTHPLHPSPTVWLRAHHRVVCLGRGRFLPHPRGPPAAAARMQAQGDLGHARHPSPRDAAAHASGLCAPTRPKRPKDRQRTDTLVAPRRAYVSHAVPPARGATRHSVRSRRPRNRRRWRLSPLRGRRRGGHPRRPSSPSTAAATAPAPGHRPPPPPPPLTQGTRRRWNRRGGHPDESRWRRGGGNGRRRGRHLPRGGEGGGQPRILGVQARDGHPQGRLGGGGWNSGGGARHRSGSDRPLRRRRRTGRGRRGGGGQQGGAGGGCRDRRRFLWVRVELLLPRVVLVI